MSRSLIEVADGVLVATSRRDLTTCVVVVHGSEALLIDPSWEPDELQGLADALADAGLTVSAGFATHAHHDHMLWHPAFGTAPRWASPAAAAAARLHREELVESLGPQWPEELAVLVGVVQPLPDRTIGWAGQAAEIVVHDGHSTGHAALWLPQSRVLLAGDMLSDVELPLTQETGLEAYHQALELLLPYVEAATMLVPGHGRPTSSPGRRWEADRRYLDALLAGERRILDQRMTNPDMEDAHRANLAGRSPQSRN